MISLFDRPACCRALLCFIVACQFAVAAAPADGQINAAARLATLNAEAQRALARSELSNYRGWIKFLRFEAQSAVANGHAKPEETSASLRRLEDWLHRIENDPKLLSSLRGVQEWAYESPVDGSGQPFKLGIPTDYDPNHPAALSVYMHGSGGNHLEHATAMVAHPGGFELSVLGRARDGGYRALSEADVLQAIDYIEAHWAIDANRIALRGGSMGGGGTYRLGSRYPQRWASGRPVCGFASTLPMGNLLTLPIYAIHSADDPVVSILHERGPIAVLNAMGGQAILDETNGLGHFAWDYKEGNVRAIAWLADKVRPESRTIRHIDYTAVDGIAMRGWWGEIVEWGAEPRNARFVLTAGTGNALYATLTNVRRLKLRLAEAPFDAAQPLRVSVNGSRPIVLPAPLPAEIELGVSNEEWKFVPTPEKHPFRLRTPGSANLLYDGEPLLIVYGTEGSAAERAAMKAAAEAASRGCTAAWPDGSGEAGPDGVPNSYNLYGQLRVKTDRDVTDEEIANCHLVLIGTAVENRLVARIATSLPVRFDHEGIVCSDGARFSGSDLALGLVYYNPLAPQRLIFWVAGNASTYAPGALIPQVMSGVRNFSSNSFGADLLVMPAGKMTVLCARSFDSRWQWSRGREASPALDGATSTREGFAAALGRSICRASGTDLALIPTWDRGAEAVGVVGVTRASDLSPFFANVPIGIIEVSGAELLRMDQILAKTPQSGITWWGFEAKRIVAERTYRVSLPVDVLWPFSALFQPAPPGYRLTEIDTRDAIERFLGAGPLAEPKS